MVDHPSRNAQRHFSPDRRGGGLIIVASYVGDPRHVHNPEGINYDPAQVAFEELPSPYEHNVAASISNEFLNRYLALLPEAVQSDIAYCLASDEFDTYECDTCGRIVHRPVSSCKNHYCPVCATWYSLRKAMKSFDRLRPFYYIDGSEKHGQFIKLIFNIPSECWPDISDHASMDRLITAAIEAATKFIVAVARKDLKCRFSRSGLHFKSRIRLGLLAFVHTWDRDLVWRPHIEVILPNLVLLGRNNRPMRFKYYRSEKELKALREKLWPAVFFSHFGWFYDTIDVHYGFFSSEAHVIHRLKYGIRPPIPEDSNPDPVLMLGHFKFREKYRVQRWYGFLSTRQFKDARAAVASGRIRATSKVELEDGYDKSSQSRPIPCPDPSCPGFLKSLGRYNSSELKKLYGDRGLDPPRALLWVAFIRSPTLRG